MTYSEHSKRLVRIFLPFLLIALLLFLTACGTPLPAPSGVNIDEITLTLSWNPVNGADYYTVRIDGNGGSQEVDSGKNSYSLERLSEGSYTLRVKAVVGSGSDTYTDSAWSQSISFTREHETGLTFRQIESNTAFEVSGLGAAQGDIVVPDVYRGLPVIRIGDKAFYNKNTVTSVSLGSNIREIGTQAFANCSALKSITLSEGLLTIGDQAFQSCRALESALTLPDSVTSIGAQAFEYCRALPSVNFGGKLTSIGTKAFNGCSALTSVSVPDNVKSLGDGAFSACSALSSVTLGSGITAIGTDTFRRCTSLTAFTAGANVQSIGDYAFAESTALAAVTIGDNVRSIGTQAFYGCTALTDVTLGSGVEQIAKQAFHQTGLWQESGATYVDGWFLGTKDTASPVTLEDGTIGIADYAFDGYDNFDATLVIPDSVRYIGAGAFKDSKSLANVVIGGGVESIGDEAFSGCTGLTNAILGKLQDGTLTQSSLISIGDYAFRGCTALMDITMPDTLERVGMYAFRDSGLWTSATREVYAGNWLVECKDNDSYGSLSFPEGTALHCRLCPLRLWILSPPPPSPNRSDTSAEARSISALTSRRSSCPQRSRRSKTTPSITATTLLPSLRASTTRRNSATTPSQDCLRRSRRSAEAHFTSARSAIPPQTPTMTSSSSPTASPRSAITPSTAAALPSARRTETYKRAWTPWSSERASPPSGTTHSPTWAL